MSAKGYPLRHISIRVPWHDAGWNGTVCADPKRNTSCLKLINIAEAKNESAEQALAGQSLKDIDPAAIPPCLKERGTFMAPFAIDRLHEHPYAHSSNESHAHFRPTPLHYPAYAAAGLPFRWMMRPEVFGAPDKGTRGLIEHYPLKDVDRAFEPNLRFDTHWIQDYRNHHALFECFWSHVRVDESLVFFYAKQVPLVEDTGRRMLIGAGRVLKIGPLTEYKYDGSPDGKIRSLLWERMVVHSIRSGFRDGFLLPYHDALIRSIFGVVEPFIIMQTLHFSYELSWHRVGRCLRESECVGGKRSYAWYRSAEGKPVRVRVYRFGPPSESMLALASVA